MALRVFHHQYPATSTIAGLTIRLNVTSSTLRLRRRSGTAPRTKAKALV
jgi:hypothetical protein